ncbi:MAG: hypothetical protein KatS3mg068_1540 [Candidatus Sericytochromatia bacterium]|nr:MAG: hypothetical protein KatS3mg068_1540 [Candidatus Sericytochromatia bacterium]
MDIDLKDIPVPESVSFLRIYGKDQIEDLKRDILNYNLDNIDISRIYVFLNRSIYIPNNVYLEYILFIENRNDLSYYKTIKNIKNKRKDNDLLIINLDENSCLFIVRNIYVI